MGTASSLGFRPLRCHILSRGCKRQRRPAGTRWPGCRRPDRRRGTGLRIPDRWQWLSLLYKYWRSGPGQLGQKALNRARFRAFAWSAGRRRGGTTLAMDEGVMRKNQRGFTIIELLVVVAVISVLALISFTLYSNVQSRSRLAKAQADTRTMASAIGLFQAHMGQMPAV